MIPVIIQKRGAVHLDETDEAVAASLLLDEPGRFRLIPDPAALDLIPESVARENLVLPLRWEGHALVVAAVDADNIPLRDKLTFILNKTIRLVGFPRGEIQAAINRHYGQSETESVDS